MMYGSLLNTKNLLQPLMFVSLGLGPLCQNHCGRKRAGWMRSRFCVSPILGAQKAVRTCSPASDMDAINGCCHSRPTAMMQ